MVSDAAGILPSAVVVCYPYAVSGVLTSAYYPVQINLSARATNYRGYGVKTFHNDHLAASASVVGGVPSNASTLLDLTTTVADSYWGYLTAANQDVDWPGVLPLSPEGLHDIEFEFWDEMCGTRVLRGPWNLDPEELMHASGSFVPGEYIPTPVVIAGNVTIIGNATITGAATFTPAGVTNVALANDVTASLPGPYVGTLLLFNPLPFETWKATFTLTCLGSGSGMTFKVTGPTAPTYVTMTTVGNTTSAAATSTDTQTAFGAATNAYMAGTFTGTVTINLTVGNGPNAGPVILTFASVLPGQTQTILKGSTLAAQKLS